MVYRLLTSNTRIAIGIGPCRHFGMRALIIICVIAAHLAMHGCDNPGKRAEHNRRVQSVIETGELALKIVALNERRGDPVMTAINAAASKKDLVAIINEANELCKSDRASADQLARLRKVVNECEDALLRLNK